MINVPVFLAKMWNQEIPSQSFQISLPHFSAICSIRSKFRFFNLSFDQRKGNNLELIIPRQKFAERLFHLLNEVYADLNPTLQLQILLLNR